MDGLHSTYIEGGQVGGSNPHRGFRSNGQSRSSSFDKECTGTLVIDASDDEAEKREEEKPEEHDEESEGAAHPEERSEAQDRRRSAAGDGT